MMFDSDTIYDVLNDPNGNLDLDSIFMFDPNSESVKISAIDSSMPPKFIKSVPVNATSTSTTGTSAATTANKFDYKLALWFLFAVTLFFDKIK